MSANFKLKWIKEGNTMKYAKTISTVLILASLLAACGGGGGGGGSAPAGPTYYPPTIVDCLGAGSTGAIAATSPFPQRDNAGCGGNNDNLNLDSHVHWLVVW